MSSFEPYSNVQSRHRLPQWLRFILFLLLILASLASASLIFTRHPAALLLSLFLAILSGVEMALYDRQSVWSVTPRHLLGSAGFILFAMILFNITVALTALLTLSSLSDLLP